MQREAQDIQDLSREQRDLLYRRLSERRRTAQPAGVAICRAERADGKYPLSSGQKRFWFLEQLNDHAAVYNLSLALRVVGPLDLDALKCSLDAIVARHDILRTTFVAEDGEPLQQANLPSCCDFAVLDLKKPFATLVQDTATDRLDAILADEIGRPMRLDTGPLLKLRVLKTAPGDHVLLLIMHHIVADGWSLGVLFKELAHFYGVYRGHGLQPLPALRIQYKDFADWQQAGLREPLLRTRLELWKRKLADAPSLLDLPTDYPRTAQRSFVASSVPLAFTPELSAGIAALCREEGVTLFMFMLAAYVALLARYAGSRDIVVGSPIANRPSPDLESLIGFFVNNLVLRVQIEPAIAFKEFLQRVKQITLAAYEHQDVPFDALVDELRPARNLSYEPLIQAALILHDTTEGSLELPGVQIYGLPKGQRLSRHDLSLILNESRAGLSGEFEYRCDLFQRSSIERMAAHLDRLIRRVLQNPGRRWFDAFDLTATEHARLREWNGSTEVSRQRDEPLAALFEAHAAESPDAVSVAFEHEHLTYESLNAHASELAARLIERGITPETRVAVCLRSGPALVSSFIALMKAGATYVPVALELPQARRQHIQRDAAVALTITTSDLARSLGPQAPYLALDEGVSVPSASGRSRALASVHPGVVPQSAAYMIYTSGTTGRPKGSTLTHGGMSNLYRSLASLFRVQRGSRMLQFASIGFDVSVSEIIASVCSGATLICADRDDLALTGKLAALIAGQRATHLMIPPSILAELSADDLRCVHHVLVGGEPFAESLYAQWQKDRVFLNAYGPTEATVCATIAVDADVTRAGRISIGRPLVNTTAHVLDAFANPQPPGVAGQLYLGGAGLARGYHNNPALTALRFIPNPCAAYPGERLYASGDLARFRTDGALEFLGRVDQQIKIHGVRIEPQEIEKLLAGHPLVRESVVVARQDQRSGVQLVAYVVTGNAQHQAVGASLAREFREYLARELPTYMLPSAFVFLDSLPLTAHGKIDRQALPAPQVLERYSAPETLSEKVLSALWRDLLGVERVGRDDDFFHLGGHSLLAAKLVARVREALQIELAIRTIFESPVLQVLAKHIEALSAVAGTTALPVLPVPRTMQLPLSFAQQRLWFIGRLQGPNAIYNIPLALRFTGAVNAAVLLRCLQEIVCRHEILRTRIVEEHGCASQRILDPDVNGIAVESIAGEDDLRRICTAESQYAFDLDRDVPWRARLLAISESDCTVLITMHHAVADGWSLGVLLRELTVLYDAFTNARPSPLQPLQIQYADFAYWQRNWLKGPELAKQLAYWMEQLRDLPPLLALPLDKPRPAIQMFRGARERFMLPASLADALNTLSRREGVTLFMTLLAAFNALLGRYTGQRDIAVGTPVSDRPRREFEPLIGLFLNTLVLRSDLSGNPSFCELLQRTRSMALQAYSHQDMPFEHLLEALQVPRSMSYTPLFQVMFVVQNIPAEKTAPLPGIDLSPVAVESGVAKHDLTLTVSPTERGIGGILEYNVEIFEAATAQRLIEDWQCLLAEVTADPLRQINSYRMLCEAHRAQLATWNSTTVACRDIGTIPELFEAQASLTPDAIAVSQGARQLSYAQLNCCANQLAHYLRARGVAAESRVGLCAERSPELIIGLLAVLKAGGAYVPLDPSYPQQRLAYMQESCAIRIVLTQREQLAEQDFSDREIVLLDPELQRRLCGGWPDENVDREVRGLHPDNAAYVMFTSGTTGRPNGAIATHGAVVRLVDASNYLHFGAEHIFLVNAPIAFDASTFELFGTLLFGARAVLADPDRLSAQSLGAAIRDHSVTTLWLTAALFHVLADENVEVFKGIRHLVTGGDVISPALLNKVLVEHPGIELFNGYGPTENTTFSTACKMLLPVDARRAVPIGRPLQNTQTYILDEALNPLPIAVVGDLYVADAGLQRGYVERRALTAQRFVPNPFGIAPGRTMYRTGDLARHLPNGDIEFVGRRDHQVKIRGYRIEPAEIEALLARQVALKDAAVVVAPGSARGKSLLAFVVPRSQQGLHQPEQLIAQVKQYLADELPEYMLPAAFAVMEKLPLTPSGKLDRRVLVEQHASAPPKRRQVAPATEIEAALVSIWQEVLGVTDIGVTDNFFELGGDSIISIQVVSRARHRDLQFSPRDLFEHQTIADLAPLVSVAKNAAPPCGTEAGEMPLLPVQHWFFEQALEDRHHYNQSVLLEWDKPIDAAIASRVLQALIAHHDALRLTFVHSGAQWIQSCAAGLSCDVVAILDVSELDEAEQIAALQAACAKTQGSLCLQTGALVKGLIVKRGTQAKDLLLLVIHHLLTDGVSWRVVLEDLAAAYRQLDAGAEISLPAKTTSFHLWTQHVAACASTSAVREQLPYWIAQLSGVPAQVPLDRPDGENIEADSDICCASLPQEQTRNLLQEVPKAYGTEINDALLTALVLTLSDWLQSDSVLIDLEGHGREDVFDGVDVSRTVGWFTSIFPLRLVLPAQGRASIGRCMRSIKEQVRRIPQRGFGYGVLRYKSGDPATVRALAHAGSAQISFNYLGQFGQEASAKSGAPFARSSLWHGATFSPRQQRAHLLDFGGAIVDGCLQLSCRYSSNHHHAATIQQLIRAFSGHLRNLIDHCCQEDAGAFTPADVPEARIEQAELDEVMAGLRASHPGLTRRQVAAIYPLSPLQMGMLYHSSIAPQDGHYVVQAVMSLQGLAVAAFQAAWEHVVARHDIYRTLFTAPGSAHPLQVVLKNVALQWQIEDWRERDPRTLKEALDAVLIADRAAGFAAGCAPLLRFKLLQIAADSHWFLWTHHHAVADGWSMPITLQDVASAYEALCKGMLPALPPVRPYRDYIRWLCRQGSAGSEDFWRNYLAGVTPPPALSLRPAPPARDCRTLPRSCLWAFSEESTRRFEELIRRERLTAGVVTQLAWALLLSRYTCTDDIVFGLVVSGRPADLPGVERMIGPFINTIPVRVRVDRDCSVLTLLRNLQQDQMGRQPHEHTSLSDIQRWCGIKADAPLFSSLFVFENYPLSGSPFMPRAGERAGEPCLTITGLRGIEETHYALTAVAHLSGRLTIDIRYDARQHEASAVQRLLGHYRKVLEGIICEPHAKAGSLSLLAADEVQQILFDWNATATVYPWQRCVHEIIERQAVRTPDAIAAVSADEQLTYGELNRRADRLARHLELAGVAAEGRVGLFLDRSPELLVGILGILKSGGVYVPLDPTYPADRLSFMARSASVHLVLTDAVHRDRCTFGPAPVVCLKRDWPAIERRADGGIEGMQHLGALAYMIYTSGSTGRPKGVMNTHGGLLNRLSWMQAAYPIDASDRILQKTPISFDVSVWELLWPLLSGACVVLARPEGHKDAGYLQQVVLTRHISVMHFVPSMLQAFLAYLGPDAALPLKRVICSGEALSSVVRDQFFARLEQVELHNLYGPTEAAIDVSYRDCRRERHLRTVPIGKPIGNTTLYVLDACLNPVPAGIVGELHIGGMNLARGYQGQAALTAERFIPHPFSTQGAERLYRTGDLARHGLDGEIEFVGRRDHQVKIRGLRVETGEIEDLLERHASVERAAVLPIRRESGSVQLVAYVVPCAAARADDGELPEQLRTYLKKTLPPYMIPATFVFRPSLPLTVSGKVDRQALPAPQWPVRSEPSDARVLTEQERTLAAIWGQVLNVTPVSIEDNFFELGGDSIIGLQIVARARQAGLHFTPTQLFEHQTVGALARVASKDPLRELPQDAVSGAAPLLPIQHWFFEHARVDLHHFNQAMVLESAADLDTVLLAECLAELARHHDALRLGFAQGPQGWRQEHHPCTEPPRLQVLQLETLPAGEQLAQLDAAFNGAQRDLRLDAGMLLRAVCAKRVKRPHGVRDVVLLVIHHLAVDGVSWQILLEDLDQAYRQRMAGAAVRLAPKTTSYQAWANKLAAYSHSELLRAELPFWCRQLQAGDGGMPVDYPDGANTIAAADLCSVELGEEPTRRLLQVAPQAYRTEINDLLLTALALALSEWLGRDNVLVDVEGHGREDLFEDVDLSRTVGWFTSIYPVRLQIDAQCRDLGQCLKAVKEQLRAIAHRGVGFGVLRYLSAAGAAALRDLPAAPVSFNYLGQLAQDGAADRAVAGLHGSAVFHVSSIDAGLAASSRQTRPHLLDLVGAVRGGRLQLTCLYSRNVYMPVTVEQLVLSLRDKLSALIEHCCDPQSGGFTPADVPELTLSQQDLDHVLEDLQTLHASTGLRGIAAIYPMAPLQRGMLLHSQLQPDSGEYVVQTVLSLQDVDEAALQQAWTQIVARHDVYRTAFIGLGTDHPLQAVWKHVVLPWQVEDLSAFDAAQREQRFTALLAADRGSGFDFACAPLLRFTLVRFSQRECRLLWTQHHAIVDGWSLPIVLREMTASYLAQRRGSSAQLGSVQPFRRYVRWVSQQDRQSAQAFWREYLAGMSAPTRLGLAAPADAASTASAPPQSRKVVLGREQSERLQALVRRERLTVSIVLQGTWALLLSRYSGDREVLFGSVVAGRPASLPGVETMVGPFINTVPVRVSVASQAPVLGWLKELHAAQLARGPYEFLPLADIQRCSGMAAPAGLFETLFVFENYPIDHRLLQAMHDPDGLIISGAAGMERTQYPLAVLTSMRGQLAIEIQYEERLFDASAIERLLGHYQALLDGVIGNARRTLASLPLLTEAEQRQIEQWNATQRPYPRDSCFHELFAAQAAKQPDAVAVICEREQVTYAELNERANRLACQLRAQAVGPEVRVGVCMPRSSEMVVGFLGILKAGGVYVPLDPALPAERIEHMLAVADVRIVLGSCDAACKLPADRVIDTGTQSWQQLCARLPAADTVRSAIGLDAGHLAFIIFTSGTTGRAKGSQLSHRGLVNLAMFQQRALGVDGCSRVLQFASLSFDASVWEMAMALALGGALCIGDQRQLLSRAAFTQFIMAQAVTHVTLPPSVLATLSPVSTRYLKCMVSAGEACSTHLVQQYAGRCRFINAYGPSESTICASMFECTASDGRAPIGRAIDNTALYVLGGSLQLQPVGVTGELCIASAGLSRGYQRLPALTARRFVPNPFSGCPGERLYRTGDLARYLPDGNIEFIGRADQQVKIRGFRIELAEIESILCHCTELSAAAVSTWQPSQGNRKLVAYLVARQGQSVPQAEIRRLLRRHLPEYMIPSAFVFVDALPLTSSGKLDRQALPEPDLAATGVAGRIGPSTQLERTLVEIWSEVLRVPPEQISVHDNFFDLGGHSLDVVKVQERLSRVIDRKVSVVDMFSYASISSLCGRLLNRSEVVIDREPALQAGKERRRRLRK